MSSTEKKSNGQPISAESFVNQMKALVRTSEAQDPLVNEDIADRRGDRLLKKTYAIWFIWILIGQLVVMNLIIVAKGLRWLELGDNTLQLYLAGTLLEVFGIVAIITRSLFRNNK